MRETQFQHPDPRYRVRPILHVWPQERGRMMDALRACGFGGVVTNVHPGDGFVSNPDNLRSFAALLRELDQAGLDYWIYDEQGYPSGFAGGEALTGHPELEAKGFYMRRKVAYEPCTAEFRLDMESDRIVWAAKYPLDTASPLADGIESRPCFDRMQPVPFSAEAVSCALEAEEILYVFCVKSAYEGSHCTHNVCSHKRYINVMDPRAVRRFIDLCYEPIAAAAPEAYARAGGVFTDEPSVMTSYVREYEVWPYALAPWVDGLFEAYETMYGHSLLPRLPLLFEGEDAQAGPVRVRYYELVGSLIARNYTGQLAAWCAAHGGRFSGHYIYEEDMWRHVKFYGNLLRVVMASGYPGVDLLECVPEYYDYNTAKHVQMAVRKRGDNGMMVELCPFLHKEELLRAPLDNLCGVLGLLFLGGVRTVHSYCHADYAACDPALAGYEGLLSPAEAVAFNEYAGRLGCMLDGLQNECGVFVYFGLEDVQAKTRPDYTEHVGPEAGADRWTRALTRAIYEAGHDFYYADRDDLVAAAASLRTGGARISGQSVRAVLIPALDVVYDETLEALTALQNAGVPVRFVDRLPSRSANAERRTLDCHAFQPSTLEETLALLNRLPRRFHAVPAPGSAVPLQGAYRKEGRALYLLVNPTRSVTRVRLEHDAIDRATLWRPDDGSRTPVRMGSTVTIPPLRSVFVWMEGEAGPVCTERPVW